MILFCAAKERQDVCSPLAKAVLSYEKDIYLMGYLSCLQRALVYGAGAGRAKTGNVLRGVQSAVLEFGQLSCWNER